ncbi:MAG TPA: PQQ-binding-like beta-propeller repeat protein [Sphingomonadaceae bacterium]|nr:PQQ-binding-like beta-propeller repeat protein [Sphingomonadaceae bacterium]
MTTRSPIAGAVGAAALAALLAGCGIFQKAGPKVTPTIGERRSVLGLEAQVEADASLAGVAVTLPPAELNTAWTQPGGSPSKSLGHLSLGGALTPAFSVSIGQGASKFDRLGAAPVVAEGRIFTVDTTGTVSAFDAATGARVWSAQPGTDSKNKYSLFGGGVSYDGGRVYATNGVGAVSALDAKTGAVAWTVRPGGPLRGAPTVADGNLYVMSQDSQIFSLKAADGTTQWSEAAPMEIAGVFGTGAPAFAQGTVVAGFASGDLNAYRYENGRPLWNDALSRTSISTSVSSLSDIDAAPVIDNGRVYAVGQGGRMVALELTTGQRLWELNIAGISTPWVAGEWIFVVTDDARLLAIARATGKIRWISQLARFRDAEDKKGPISWNGPVLAGGRLILTNSAGQMASVNPVDGTLLSTTNLNRPVSLSPVVANNMLYILDDDGKLTAYRGA